MRSAQLTARACRMLETIAGRIGNTPLRAIRLELRPGHWQLVNLKLEGYNPAGSIKDRTAVFLIRDLLARGLLRSDAVLTESTSGNLGVALAMISQVCGWRFVAVIDHKISDEIRSKCQEHGATLELVTERDSTGNSLTARLKRVKELCAVHPNYVWVNQYANPGNPRAHYETTAPEIFRQMDGVVDAVFIAVGTGGTLAGVGKFFREHSPVTRLIAVDAVGSVIFGGKAGRRLLSGIGSARTSDFITTGLYDTHLAISDSEAFNWCHALSMATDVRLGGSSGAVLAACANYVALHPECERVICVCPDSGENYGSTIYNDSWLDSHGFCSRRQNHVRLADLSDARPLTRIGATI